MSNIITPITFQKKFKTSVEKPEAKSQAVVGSIKEEDVKNIIQKTTTPGLRKAILGVASFLTVMFAVRRLGVTPLRTIIYKASPKVKNAVHDFASKAEPFLAEVGNNLKRETKNFLNGEKFLDAAKKITRNDNMASKLVSGTIKAAKHLGAKASDVVKWGLKNPDKVLDYTLAGSVALLSSKGIIKMDNLSSKKKLENILGDDEAKGKE